jgi:hypothetical protein
MNRYFVCGERPVYFETAFDGSLECFKLDWETMSFVPGAEYIKRILFGRGEVWEFDNSEFSSEVERIKKDVNYIPRDKDALIRSACQRSHKGLKDPVRFVEKAIEDYAGHIEMILDISSEDLVFDSMDKLRDAARALYDDDKVTRMIDRFSKPLPSGYSDLIVNVQSANGAIMEMRVHLQAVYDLFKEHNQIVSSKIDPIVQDAQSEGRHLRRLEADVVSETLEELNRLYSIARAHL